MIVDHRIKKSYFYVWVLGDTPQMRSARFDIAPKTRICIDQYLVQRVNRLYKGRGKSGILTYEEQVESYFWGEEHP